MYSGFSQSSLKVMAGASRLSQELNHFYIGVEHVFAVLLAQPEPALLGALRTAGGDPGALAREFRRLLRPGSDPPWGFQLRTTPRAERVLGRARSVARAAGSGSVEPAHLSAALLDENRGLPSDVLRSAGLDVVQIREALGEILRSGFAAASGGALSDLARFTRDLTREAAEGRLTPVVGRRNELRRMAQILLRKEKGNVVVVGEAGVGKSCLVYGLACELIRTDAPPAFRGVRLLELRLSSIVAGTRYRGDLEERVEGLLRDLRSHPEIVLFVDEIHNLVGAGAAIGGLNLGDMFKGVLADGRVRFIGATTTQEYERIFAREPALSRRFEAVRLDESSPDETLEILRQRRSALEAHFGVELRDETLVRAVALAQRYLSERKFPDKAIDLVEDACARAALESLTNDENAADERRVVDPARVEQVVAQRIGVSEHHLSQSDAQRIAALPERLREWVHGQDEAVRTLAEAVQSRWVGLGRRDRPIGIFLLVGPTGVGKTEMARALATTLFGSERQLVRFDMSEYGEPHTVSRLLGAPPGYVGFEEGGLLASAVRAHPYCVLLLDEIEKAHPELHKIFLQVFDYGSLTSSRGDRLDFRNVLILMTSNLGSREAARPIGFVDDLQRRDELHRQSVEAEVARAFSPEFRNRIDRVIHFRYLSDPAVLQAIVARSLRQHLESFEREHRVQFEPAPALLEALAREGFSPEFGGRELHRAVDRQVVAPLADWILRLERPLSAGQRIRLGWDGGLWIDLGDGSSGERIGGDDVH